ncbi:SDR family oxidoreductase [Actomonas aquatica]|uniref:SDR family oxidoreductase n=1 Tax=Actomonas aquatica TaxID=2866162 RepID=A0ABZ1C8P7_9BACT|nr:SDR family oxidoreductase [Opitutus sp. WL0086]WRQ87843.1 SDR family oxidoreductase [Opitutus sp. WL0086]
MEKSPSLFSLQGRRALVTGSGRGLGFSLARGLARAGAAVVLNDVAEDRLAAGVELLRGEGAAVEGCRFDVTDPLAVQQAIAQLTADGGAIDILVNNAGIHRYAALDTMSLAQWNDVLSVNLTGAFLVAQAVIGGMKRRGGGKIINICSLMSEGSRPTTGNYTAAKGGLKLLTKSMAVEWGAHGVQANGIGPGYILSDMTRHLAADPQFDGWVRSRTPAGRWGTPDDLVGAAVFLASPAADFVNGHVIYVDGGWLAAL